MEKYIAPISEIGFDNLVQVGGKGANLGELTRAGHCVPSGFSVKVTAFDDFLAVNQLRDTIHRIAKTIDFKNLPEVESKTAEIRRHITQSEIPVEITNEIADAYAQLHDPDHDPSGALTDTPAPLVAVRSSVGTRDGSRSSFPGQMDTYHNISGAPAVIELVRKCWASAWSTRAACTVHTLGIDYRNILIAPLIQRMVPAETAGVLFTVNPQNADSSQVMLNACFGLGEGVVSGRIDPDQYVVCKDTYTVLTSHIGKKAFKIVHDTSGSQGNCEIPLSARDACAACLTDAQIIELASTGVRIEQHYGVPQDIEWAYVGDRLFILQSRRITGLERIEAARNELTGEVEEKKPECVSEWVSEFDTVIKDPPDTFTSANISEVLPGVLSPLSQTGLKHLDYGFWKANIDFGLIDQPFPEGDYDYLFLGFFYGRAHLNLSMFNRIVAKIPGASAAEFDRPMKKADNAADISVPASFKLRQVPFLTKVALKSLVVRLLTPSRLRRQTARMHRQLEEFRKIDLRQKDLNELIDLIDRNRDLGQTVMVLHIINSMFAVATYEVLRKLTRRWLKDKSGALASRLVTGLGNIESAKPSFEIYRLYRLAGDAPLLQQIFLEQPPDTVLGRLQQEKAPDAVNFLAELNAFLQRYGYRSVFEAEMMLPSWEQDPSFVFSLIQSYLKADHVKSPEETEARQQEDRRVAETEALKKLPFPRRLIFKRVLKDARTFIPGRENNKAILMMGTHMAKKILNEIKRRLAANGDLPQEDDIYFLSQQELRDLCRENRPVPVDRIKQRRDEYNRNQTITLPEQFTGRPRPITQEEDDDATADPHLLKGLAVSPGKVTGPARVIMNPRQDAHIESGEILVVPVTDASWTPLFLMAAALVVDIGGLLSHGSIVAREYGIPGVLNVISGTKRIKTGQIITVDGNKGEVYLHDDAGASTSESPGQSADKSTDETV